MARIWRIRWWPRLCLIRHYLNWSSDHNWSPGNWTPAVTAVLCTLVDMGAMVNKIDCGPLLHTKCTVYSTAVQCQYIQWPKCYIYQVPRYIICGVCYIHNSWCGDVTKGTTVAIQGYTNLTPSHKTKIYWPWCHCSKCGEHSSNIIKGASMANDSVCDKASLDMLDRASMLKIVQGHVG